MPLSQGTAAKEGGSLAKLKNQIGLRRLRLRRLKFVAEQFFLAAAAQNIKRLVRFLGLTFAAGSAFTNGFPRLLPNTVHVPLVLLFIPQLISLGF